MFRNNQEFLTRVTLAAVTLMGMAVQAQADEHIEPGQVRPVDAGLPPGSSPEGIALDPRGNLFVANRYVAGGAQVSEVRKVTPDGTVTVIATLATTTNASSQGVLGLATDAPGNVYAALATFDSATHGVWCIGRDGSTVRVPGSEQIVFPNALTFDARGSLYVTDSVLGAVWRLEEGGSLELWVQDALLAPNPPFPGFPAIGANGIAFARPDTLFVANTSQAIVVRFAIRPDGTAGQTEVVAQSIQLFAIDGIAVDVHGDVHAVIPGFTFFGTHPLVRIDPDTGAIDLTPTEVSVYDAPLSLAFGRGPRDHKSLFITNGALFPVGPGPGIIQAGVDVRGFPGH